MGESGGVARRGRARVADTTMIPAAATVAIAGTLEVDGRLGAEANFELVGEVLEVRRRESLVVIVPTLLLHKEPLATYMDRIATGQVGLVLVGQLPRGFIDKLPSSAIATIVEDGASGDGLYLAVHGALERVQFRQQSEKRGRLMTRYRYELSELIEIARAVTQERDIERLLSLILQKSRYITGADAGSIYVVEGDDPDVRRRTLRFKLSQNESCKFESREFTIPVSTRSIAGAAVVTRKPINIPDVYAIPAESPYGFDRSFDEKVGYVTRSMLAVPLISAEEEVIGVIQLINRKREPDKLLRAREDFDAEVVPFDQRSEELLATLAAQAGIALENAMLYAEIRTIFEGFVRASVQAIEQRDPTTSGHSLRVSVLSCGLAEVVDRTETGPYALASFSKKDLQELEYASLLHDFGKIGVREQVLVKAKKLYPHEIDAIRSRFDYVVRSSEVDALARKLELARQGASHADLDVIDEELRARRAEIEDTWRFIQSANEPSVLKQGDFTRIAELAAHTYADPRGQVRPLLTPEEIVSLQVTKGSLSSGELDEIRSHVVHTFNFLSRIPWGRSYNRIPAIAGSHHERLNGTGYPNRLSGEEIPLQSKIMTVADIYDALTARDRPYKKALPRERALDILGFEVKDGHVDGELVRIFVAAEVFKVVERDLSY